MVQDHGGCQLMPFRNLTVLIGFVTAFPMSLALMFSMKDMDSVINSKLPSAELFYQITGSRIVVTIIMVWIILIYFRMHWASMEFL